MNSEEYNKLNKQITHAVYAIGGLIVATTLINCFVTLLVKYKIEND